MFPRIVSLKRASNVGRRILEPMVALLFVLGFLRYRWISRASPFFSVHSTLAANIQCLKAVFTRNSLIYYVQMVWNPIKFLTAQSLCLAHLFIDNENILLYTPLGFRSRLLASIISLSITLLSLVTIHKVHTALSYYLLDLTRKIWILQAGLGLMRIRSFYISGYNHLNSHVFSLMLLSALVQTFLVVCLQYQITMSEVYASKAIPSHYADYMSDDEGIGMEDQEMKLMRSF